MLQKLLLKMHFRPGKTSRTMWGRCSTQRDLSKPVVFGEGDGGGLGLLFTAMHPQRVSALILANTTARMLSAPDYPIGIAPEAADAMVEMLRSAGHARARPRRVPKQSS